MSAVVELKGRVRHRWDVPTPMRDGVALSSDVYLPPAQAGDGPFPALVMRTPYGAQDDVYVDRAHKFAEHGYAVVLQDVRGRYDSQGEWRLFRDEGPDGYDTIEWTAGQPWCNGRVGTYGASYGGWCQWRAALQRPPHLVTMVSTAAPGRWLQESPYHNGLLTLVVLFILDGVGGRTNQNNGRVDWGAVFGHLPLRTMDEVIGRPSPVWQEWLDHPTLDEYWRERTLGADDFAAIDLPVLHVTGWHDEDQPGALFHYEGMVRHSPAAGRQALIVGPWDHGATSKPSRHRGGIDFGESSELDMDAVHLEWFDRWLRGDGGDETARYYVSGANEWRTAPQWPPAGTRSQRWYLDSSGRLSPQAPEADSSAGFTYDPADPVLTWGTVNPMDLESDPPLDGRRLLDRDDVLVYTSDEMTEPLTVAGNPSVVLVAGSDCADTDWVVTLHDVAPDGASVYLTRGMMRARFRESLEREVLMTPGEVYEFAFDLPAVGHVFLPGHRVRLLITSSEFPMYDRNPNTGRPIGADAQMQVAHNTVHHGPGHPSRLVLPRLGE